MDEKIKPDYMEICVKVAKIFFSIAAGLALSFLVIAGMVFPDERDTVSSECRVFENRWEQLLPDGEKTPIEVPGKIAAEWGEVVTLVTTLPDGIRNGQNLCFRTIWQDVDIFVDGEHRIHYNTESSRPFGLNSAMRYIFLEIGEQDAGKEVVYQFSSMSKYAGDMREIYIGDRTSIWMQLLHESGMKAIISFFLLILSLFCIITCIILRFVYKKNLSLVYLAWTLFFCALWMVSETPFRQLLFKNVSVLTNATYWSLMLIPFPLILYINDIQQKRYQKIYMVSFAYSSLMLVIGTFLQVFDIVQFVEQVKFIHIGTGYAMISLIVTITIDMIKKRAGDYLAVGIGVYGMLVTAVIEIVLYWTDAILSLGAILGMGLLFLLIMAIVKTGQDLFRSERKQQQAIMAKEAQSKFLANMSHEIRTPINAVIGMNEMILRENENKDIQEYAENIGRASKLLLDLVNEVLDFSKIESGQLELIEDVYDLSSVIKDELLLLKTRIGDKPIAVKVNIDHKLPTRYMGDELRLKQILTNLLSNAAKYTKEGTISVSVFFQWINAEKINLCFSIADTGMGIKEEDIISLFDGFKRLELSKNRNIEGTGLGLNITKQLVELMQGSIAVKSEYGKGSTFTIFIPQKVVDKRPIGDGDAVKNIGKEPEKPEGSKFTAPNAKILAVDDNSMNLSVIKGLLKRTQVKLDLAKSGRECIELSKQKTYDMILMDHMMPELDGVETLKLIREDGHNPNCNTIVIALTANAIAGSREMYLEYGFNDYFAKPIQAGKLEELLMTYLPKEVITKGEEHAQTEPEKQEDIKTEAMETKAGEAKPEREKPEETKKAESGDDRMQQSMDELLYVDHEVGLSYCMDSEEFYQEVKEAFVEQCEEYLPELDKCFADKDWKQYGVITHALKNNALNIGATNFSKVSLEHETAGKEGNAAFIEAEYSGYMAALKALMEKAKDN